MRTCPAPWGMSAQEHTFTFCQIFFISGGNYTLVTCTQYTTMVTHSECEISQSWRTQLSSHGTLNLNRAVMPPLPLHYQCKRKLTCSPMGMDSTNQTRLPFVARAHCDVFQAGLPWQGMAKLYKGGIFVITERQFAFQSEVT